ncbi:hypothetical protein ACFONN_19555 [Dyella humi]|uniref:Uncharacterized protein n=1 Tax=Dyella humi TaxID=1770547 RepID=A0ABW8IH01_9GAMM
MKLHSIFKLNAASALSVLAIAALTASAALLSFIPVRAAAAPTLALQCQVSPDQNGVGVTLSCNGELPDGSNINLVCNAGVITENNGEYKAGGGTCNIGAGLAGITLSATPDGFILVTPSTGTIIVTNGGETVTVNGLLASAAVSAYGQGITVTLSPLSVSVLNTEITTSVKLLNTINVASIAVQGNVASVGINGSTLTISGPNLSYNGDVAGLILFTGACNNTVTANLGLLIPIVAPALSCGI